MQKYLSTNVLLEKCLNLLKKASDTKSKIIFWNEPDWRNFKKIHAFALQRCDAIGNRNFSL